MIRALGDLELFINGNEYNAYPLIKTALIHSQFETIHPFNDGNGRTGRMLIILYLLMTKQFTVYSSSLILVIIFFVSFKMSTIQRLVIIMMEKYIPG